MPAGLRLGQGLPVLVGGDTDVATSTEYAQIGGVIHRPALMQGADMVNLKAARPSAVGTPPTVPVEDFPTGGLPLGASCG